MYSSTLRPRHPTTSTTRTTTTTTKPSTSYLLPTTTTWRHLPTYTTLHHETFNIYTHLLPALLCPVLGIFTSLPPLHILSCTVCLGLSAAYHANNHQSPYALKADYCGILQLLVINFATGLHYAFAAEADRKWRDVYIWIVRLSLPLPLPLPLPQDEKLSPVEKNGYYSSSSSNSSSRRTIDIITTTTDSITADSVDSASTRTPPDTTTKKRPEDPHRTLRVTSLILTGLTALIPITHLYHLHDVRYLLAVGVGWYTLEGMALILGAVVYLNKIPEKWFPHTTVFMLWSSHAFWHVLVLVGMMAHTMGLVCAMEFAVREAQDVL
ncbi:hemolysin-III family protein [Aspergillus saccharolyticus JOP 1030-1]|uniref:Hly-III related protein n=1 Tax=Aspergillus saccharolyticus JOP 1030-1 TaxID=1450539 RepID=A0A318ZLS3_9EURO|nr:Hly-III related protein [Aspergillus saccharolyticus JOP 1030-1]PYH45413.1 Hly-III related protein [Aspergillus saccharolyticus JOP 1030-1]